MAGEKNKRGSECVASRQRVFWLFSEQESFNTVAVVVAYAGTTKPAVEEDFAVVGAENEATGWKNTFTL
ncbi:MAG: hypothetical protein QXL10_04645 [Candidatus Bathyarchaeia archaeon]